LLLSEEIIISKREFEEGIPEEYMSHKEKYEESIRRSVIIFDHVRRMQDEGRTKITDFRFYTRLCFYERNFNLT
jgi:hypothetical protein